MSLLAELNRRGVIRVAGVYLAGAWLLLQVAETVLPAYGFGDSAIRLVVTLLAIGFVPVLVLAWVFEITPSGVKVDRDLVHDAPAPPLGKSRLDRIVMVLLALALGFFLVDKFVIEPVREREAVEVAYARGRSEGARVEASEHSIVVLPFVNLSGDREQDYFSDGISEELISVLAGIPDLRVVSRSSAFVFKDANPGISEIARRLDVTHVLEGSVRLADGRVRITAQLIDARTDSHLWSRSYDRVFDDIFEVQDDIASQVVEELEVSLLGDQPGSRSADPDAYVLYLQARQLSRQSTHESYASALELLRDAVERDPRYVDAWLQMSSIYSNEAGMGLRPFDEGYRLAEDAVQAALAIDPEQARVHCQLATIALHKDRNTTESAEWLQRGLRSSPRDEWCLGLAAQLLDVMGASERSLAIERYLARRDPLNPVSSINLAYSLYLARRPEEGLAALADAELLSPGMAGLQSLTALLLVQRGSPDDLERALEVIGSESIEGFRLQVTAIVQNRLGNGAESEGALERLIDEHGPGWPFNIAAVFADRGDPDRAFEWLGRAMEAGDAGLTFARVEPLLEPLHDDPRWQPLLGEIGLSDAEISGIQLEVELPE
jgi:TolB-like protein